MKFELPYSDETIRDLAGKTVVLSDNHRNEALFRAFWTTQVKSGGDLDRGHLEVQDGVLRLMDKQGLFCDFAGAETRNGVVYAVGTAAQTVSRHGFDRIIMHERVPLAKSSFGICVSSHFNYAPTTLPILLSSIRKAGFDMANVVVVVGGDKDARTEVIEGARVLHQEANCKGFGGLLGTTGDFQYWLMLHDTCEAERSFVESVSDIDVGLSPDVVRMRDDVDDWTGFYKTSFIDRIRMDLTTAPDSSPSMVRNSVRTVTVVPGNVVETGTKDVYGRGNHRAVEKLPSGIRKYRAVSGKRIP